MLHKRYVKRIEAIVERAYEMALPHSPPFPPFVIEEDGDWYDTDGHPLRKADAPENGGYLVLLRNPGIEDE